MEVSTLSSKSTNLSRMRSTVGFKSRSSFVRASRTAVSRLRVAAREKALFSSFVGNNTNDDGGDDDDDELGFEKYSRVFSILKYSFEYSVNISLPLLFATASYSVFSFFASVSIVRSFVFSS